MKCICGSTQFGVMFQAWASADVEIIDGKPVVKGPVHVNATEMHSDWITDVQCAACGLIMHPQESADLERYPIDTDTVEVVDDPATADVFAAISTVACDFDYSTLGLSW